MTILDLSRDVVPVSEFRNNAATLLKRASEGSNLVLTLNGRAAGVLLGVEKYQEMELRLRELEAIVEGLLALRRGEEPINNEVVMAEARREAERAR